MGITSNDFYGLLYAKERGVNFTRTVMIGRQWCLITPGEIDSILKKYDDSYSGETAKEIVESPVRDDVPLPFSEPLFKYLGASQVDSLDFSDYEGATITHDMNKPIGGELKEKFSVVIDGGSLEHVFNYPLAIKNCMEMVEIGGHLVLITSGNNWFGHGFYQFNPELFFSIFDVVNGYSIVSVIVHDDRMRWYFVQPQKVVQKRFELDYTGKVPLKVLRRRASISVISKVHTDSFSLSSCSPRIFNFKYSLSR